MMTAEQELAKLPVCCGCGLIVPRYSRLGPATVDVLRGQYHLTADGWRATVNYDGSVVYACETCMPGRLK